MEALAHTLAYDAAVMGDSTMPAALISSIKPPALILNGSETGEWSSGSARALTMALPDAYHQTLEGQDHNVSWEVLAPVVRAFLSR